ncbi:venom acid phosphatase Acph-1-like [Onthophagus taurus]|uniref:venom acid phosphatase Acph-1-like n=1 Tax=Onthophagus taurus TaxID=166361 RepID=UPI000C20ED51|nr:venom acid phosphatase Acph-1-like [Onthophagus taurus]
MFRKTKFLCLFKNRNAIERLFNTDQKSLVLLHTIFRHGDRTPDQSSSYPSDPYKDHDYSPYGHGQLTNPGKLRAYKLGEFLRNRYGSFLGNFYVPEHIDAWASDFDRTKMTLQLVLAALYPPEDHQVWHQDVKWQPIPYISPPRDRDNIFLAFMCNKKALEEYDRHVKEVRQDIFKPYEDIIKFVEEKSNLKITNPRVMFAIACTLGTQEAMGLELPAWTKSIWPNDIEEVAMKEFDVLVSNPTLKSLVIGNLFKKIIEDTQMKITGKSNRKIHIYSGHDFTVGLFLRVLDVFKSHHPDFCAVVVLEVHKVNDEYGLKLVYRSKESEPSTELIIPGVQHPIVPFQKFREIANDMLTNKLIAK